MPLPGAGASEGKESATQSEQPLGCSVKIGGCELGSFEEDVGETNGSKFRPGCSSGACGRNWMGEPKTWSAVEAVLHR
jgi:hypothetical protein